jgi:[ribosomal protein S5]-alanine N-acetyltransferase
MSISSNTKLYFKGAGKMNHRLFHSLKGESIYFKALSTDDVHEIHSYASDEDVSLFIGWPLMNTLNETRSYIDVMLKRELEGTHYYASIIQKTTEAIVGTAMIFNFDHEANKAEIGYVLHKDYWGKGYGTESVALMNNFAFKTLNLHKIYANVVDENIGSARILEKNKFVLEGRLRDHYFIEDKYYDALVYGKITIDN